MNESPLMTVMTLVNDWLKFAEAKLIALSTLNGAVLFGSAQLLTTQNISDSIRVSIAVFALLSFLGEIVSIYGLMPVTNMKAISLPSPNRESANIFFYGDLARMSTDDVIDKFYAINNTQSQNRIRDTYIAQQIILNSKISLRKFRVFSIATRCVLYGFIAIPTVIITSYFLGH